MPLALSKLKLNTTEELTYIEALEAEIYSEQSLDLLDDCRNEIAFLEELEAKLAIEAEKTRIKGKTDKEMYEINYYEELIQIHTLQAQSEMMATGHVSPDTMKTLLRNPGKTRRRLGHPYIQVFVLCYRRA